MVFFFFYFIVINTIYAKNIELLNKRVDHTLMMLNYSSLIVLVIKITVLTLMM